MKNTKKNNTFFDEKFGNNVIKFGKTSEKIKKLV